jgi:hypothetical protein
MAPGSRQSLPGRRVRLNLRAQIEEAEGMLTEIDVEALPSFAIGCQPVRLRPAGHDMVRTWLVHERSNNGNNNSGYRHTENNLDIPLVVSMT